MSETSYCPLPMSHRYTVTELVNSLLKKGTILLVNISLNTPKVTFPTTFLITRLTFIDFPFVLLKIRVNLPLNFSKCTYFSLSPQDLYHAEIISLSTIELSSLLDTCLTSSSKLRP